MSAVVAFQPQARQSFAMVERDVLTDTSLTPPERLLFCLLCSYANEDGKCFPSVGRLTADLGSNRTRTFDRLRALESRGLIRRESVPGKCSVIHIIRGRPGRSQKGFDPYPKAGRVDRQPITKTGTGGVTETGTGTRNQNRDTEHTSINIPTNKTTPACADEPSALPSHNLGKGQSKQKSKRPRKPETPFPYDLALTDQLRAYAKPGVDVDADFERFRNHALTHDRRCRDWKAAWRNWCTSGYAKPIMATQSSRQQITDEQRRAMEERQ